jgi:FlaG/FlaF family flagellin (archaellin)
MISKRTNDYAVSPVVGVMLMLVVTIIIAAIVSAFAGGLATGTSKQPTMTLTAAYSQSTGMTITHNGGDTVSTQNAHFIVTPSADFGTYQHMHWTINSSVISIYTGSGYGLWSVTAGQLFGGATQATTFQPGENANISAVDLSQVQPGTYSDTTVTPHQPTTDSVGRPTNAVDQSYGFDQSGALGERFQLQLVDNSGKTIATTMVTVQP